MTMLYRYLHQQCTFHHDNSLAPAPRNNRLHSCGLHLSKLQLRSSESSLVRKQRTWRAQEGARKAGHVGGHCQL